MAFYSISGVGIINTTLENVNHSGGNQITCLPAEKFAIRAINHYATVNGLR